MFKKIFFYFLLQLIVTIDVNSKVKSQKNFYIEKISKNLESNPNKIKHLNFSILLEEGMRKGYQEKIRVYERDILKNNFKSIVHSYYLPNIDLVLDSGYKKLGSLTKSLKGNTSTLDDYASISLQIKNYSIFNWGKDYLAFKNKQETIKRKIESEDDYSRDFKQNLIYTYAKAIYQKSILKIKKEQLKNASFVYRLSKEKVVLKKTSKHVYYQARSEYLRSQQEYHREKLNVKNAYEAISFLLTDPINTEYIIKEKLFFKRIKMNREDAINFALKGAPLLKNSILEKKVSERNYEISKRNNLPLPKITLDIGTYRHSLIGNSNFNKLEFKGQVKATWNIFGDGGLFNRRKIANARFDREKKGIEKLKVERRLLQSISEIYKILEMATTNIEILGPRISSLQKQFDLSLNGLLNQKSRYNDFHLALVQLFEAKESLETLKWNYFQKKILLAQIIGIENLAGERFKMMIKEGDK